MKLLLILHAILICNQIVDGHRILGIFPSNSRNYWIMQEELMKGLVKRGYQVDVVTHFPQKNPIPNYTDINLAGSIREVCQLMDHPKIHELIKKLPQNSPFDIVITEMYIVPCYLAFGRHLNVSIVVMVASVFHLLNKVVIEVGGVHIKDDDPLPPEVQKWLDESKNGCIYFTFGSMVRIETFPKEIIEQFYASFEKITSVRVQMKVAKKENLLPGLSKNVMMQSRFPQISVLSK
ncbi:hypothetical protein EAG_10458 [Camponotus floridanus]|uniref:Ecdysteroid UDP-glucosyltransferase n=1 Tax=Camponotus floridanus TaxID=104421 RepID=E2ADX2_CAMFO|nr:hypothetical protein EAG_10458 [Camponotus floridanus]